MMIIAPFLIINHQLSYSSKPMPPIKHWYLRGDTAYGFNKALQWFSKYILLPSSQSATSASPKNLSEMQVLRSDSRIIQTNSRVAWGSEILISFPKSSNASKISRITALVCSTRNLRRGVWGKWKLKTWWKRWFYLSIMYRVFDTVCKKMRYGVELYRKHIVSQINQ